MGETIEKTERGNIPSVAIDGTRIRGVRETKKLTQLYVANVVGVTTDTISRWENNRYPTIKRENAQKLADALEVPLDEILRQDPPPQLTANEPAAPYSPSRKWLLLSGLAALLLLGVIFVLSRKPVTAPTAVRWAPRYTAPGEIIPVQIKVSRQADDTGGFILKEKFPEGMRLVSALPASSAAESSGSEAKWLIRDGSALVTISYTLRIPELPALRKQARLQGEIVLYGEGANHTEPVGGGSDIQIGAFHWADANGDGRIDDEEIMPAYYICDEMKGLGLDWKTIEAIWSGKGYKWDAKSGYTVIH